MKLIASLCIAAIGAAYYFNQGFGNVAGTQTAAEIELARTSVAYHCTRSIPRIWERAKASEETLRGVSGVLTQGAFRHVTTNFCLCMQDTLSDNRSDREKEFYGALSGYYLELKFANRLDKRERMKIDADLKRLARRFQTIAERRPAWLKKINENNRMCRKKQRIKL